VAIHKITVLGREADVQVDYDLDEAAYERFQALVREGYGEPPQDDLAARINAMSTAEFTAYRHEVGLGKSTAEFLAGL
jgi:hypothetical protein